MDFSSIFFAAIPGIFFTYLNLYVLGNTLADQQQIVVYGILIGLILHVSLSIIKVPLDTIIFGIKSTDKNKYDSANLKLWANNKQALAWNFNQQAALWGDFGLGFVVSLIIWTFKPVEILFGIWFTILSAISFFLYIHYKMKEVDTVMTTIKLKSKI